MGPGKQGQRFLEGAWYSRAGAGGLQGPSAAGRKLNCTAREVFRLLERAPTWSRWRSCDSWAGFTARAFSSCITIPAPDIGVFQSLPEKENGVFSKRQSQQGAPPSPGNAERPWMASLCPWEGISQLHQMPPGKKQQFHSHVLGHQHRILTFSHR